MKMNTRKNVRGQGMSEYLIIVALIAVAGIAVMGLFGNAARNQVAALANEVGGGSGAASEAAEIRAAQQGVTALSDAAEVATLSNFAGNNGTILAGDGGGDTARKGAINAD